MGVHEDTLRVAEDSIKMMLEREFKGGIMFGPIRVEATSDHYGEDNINIVVVYEGGSYQLDPDKLNVVSLELASVLKGMGFHNMPTESYIEKSEYQDWADLMDSPPWDPEVV